jgi:3-phosphoshikimate 1-carboxyvinyltransferase
VIVRVKPSVVKGSIVAPASKSSMQRACAAALVRKGISIISNPGISNDDKAALGIIKEMGCEWTIDNGQLIIDSSNACIHPPFDTHHSLLTINCGESGLSIRMFSPIVALSEKPITINGSGSLATRPMDFFDEVLPQLGVEIKSKNGKLPLEVKGPLQPATIHIDGSLSSQFLTGLLMAYAASNSGGKSIIVNNLKSKPYIDLTLKVMSDFGLNVPVNHNYESFEFLPANNDQPTTIKYIVEGDWSGAAFLLVAGAIASPQGILVKGLDVNSTQADKKILEALRDCGCVLSIRDVEIEIAYPSLGIKGFHFNATDCPDLFPPLVALASYCEGKTIIEGVSRLAHKESNRGLTLQQEFAKMGIQVDLQDDLMIVHGGTGVKGATTHSHHDHRIAMACAVAGLKAEGETIIEEADAINKSYPNFYEHIKQLGATVSEQEATSMDKEYR